MTRHQEGNALYLIRKRIEGERDLAATEYLLQRRLKEVQEPVLEQYRVSRGPQVSLLCWRRSRDERLRCLGGALARGGQDCKGPGPAATMSLVGERGEWE
jgi:hypothetical protein